MKKVILLIILIFNYCFCFCQSPSIEETLNYINTILSDNPCHSYYDAPNKYFKSTNSNQWCQTDYYHIFSLSGNGNIIIKMHVTIHDCRDKIDDGTQFTLDYCKFNNRDISISSTSINNNHIVLKGRNSEEIFRWGGLVTENFDLCEFSDTYDTQRCLKAIKHLFTLLQNDPNYSRNNKNDPFAPDNYSQQKAQSNSTKSFTQTTTESNTLNNYRDHFLAAPKKYLFEGVNTKETLELRYKNPQNNITYYLTSHQLPPNTNIGYYLDAYKENQKKDGFSTSDVTYKGKIAVLGKMQIQTAFIYQLHFVNIDKGQTVQMLAGKAADAEFKTFMNEIVLLK